MMRVNKRLGICLLAATLGMSVAPVWADQDCDVPIRQWQSRDAVVQLAKSRGWDLRRIKIDDGCYEIKGSDRNGRHFKAKLDPQDLSVMKMKYRDRHDRHERRERKRDWENRGFENDGPDMPATVSPRSPASSNLIGPSRGQID